VWLRRLVPSADLARAAAGVSFAAWSGGLLSVVSAVVTCLAIPSSGVPQPDRASAERKGGS
jgi:hypothetical protein